MRCVQCNNPEVTAIFAEGGGIAAYYCPRCGARYNAHRALVVRQEALADVPLPDPPAGEAWPRAACPRIHDQEHTQEVESIGGEVIARVCGLCRQRFSVSTCLGCGRDILRADGARSQFPTCSDGCAKKAAQARAKERQATQKKAEKKAARR